MTSILERLDELIRGSLHRFVDRALQNNSLALFDQDVRDMQAAVDHVEEAAVNMYAAARANERRLLQHEEDVERLERRVERLEAQEVAPTTERFMVAQAELAAKRELVAETQAQIQRQQVQYEALKRQSAELDVRAQVLQDQRPRMQSLLALARAYRSVEQVEMTLEALRGMGGDTEVAMVADSIYQRLDEAQARQDAIHEVEDAQVLAELQQIAVEEQLEARRQRLGLAPEPEVVEATPEPEPASPDVPPEPEEPPPDDAPEPEPASPDAPPEPEGPPPDDAPEAPADAPPPAA